MPNIVKVYQNMFKTYNILSSGMHAFRVSRQHVWEATWATPALTKQKRIIRSNETTHHTHVCTVWFEHMEHHYENTKKHATIFSLGWPLPCHEMAKHIQKNNLSLSLYIYIYSKRIPNIYPSICNIYQDIQNTKRPPARPGPSPGSWYIFVYLVYIWIYLDIFLIYVWYIFFAYFAGHIICWLALAMPLNDLNTIFGLPIRIQWHLHAPRRFRSWQFQRRQPAMSQKYGSRCPLGNALLLPSKGV